MLSSPIIILGLHDTKNILQHGNCALYNPHFIIFGSIISFIIPLFVMIIMYILTVRRLQKVLKEYKEKRPQLSINSPTPIRKLSVRFKDKKSDSIKTSSFKSILKKKSITSVDINSDASSETMDNKFKSLVQKHRLINQTLSAFQTNRESTAVKNEQKAVKVLGIVFVIFVIAWLPFAVFNILSAICPTCSIHPSLLNILTWFGYVSSSINPLVYNAFNEKFRIAFKQILMCRLKSLRKSSIMNQSNKVLVKLAYDTHRNNNHSISRYTYMNKVRSGHE